MASVTIFDNVPGSITLHLLWRPGASNMWQGGTPNPLAYTAYIDGVERTIDVLVWGATNQAIVGLSGAAVTESAEVELHAVDPNTRYLTGEVAPAPQSKIAYL